MTPIATVYWIVFYSFFRSLESQSHLITFFILFNNIGFCLAVTRTICSFPSISIITLCGFVCTKTQHKRRKSQLIFYLMGFWFWRTNFFCIGNRFNQNERTNEWTREQRVARNLQFTVFSDRILWGCGFILCVCFFLEIYACDSVVRCLLLVKHSNRFIFVCDKETVF